MRQKLEVTMKRQSLPPNVSNISVFKCGSLKLKNTNCHFDCYSSAFSLRDLIDCDCAARDNSRPLICPPPDFYISIATKPLRMCVSISFSIVDNVVVFVCLSSFIISYHDNTSHFMIRLSPIDIFFLGKCPFRFSPIVPVILKKEEYGE